MSKTLLDIYIETLVNRVNNTEYNNIIPPSLDIVFDGGAFNGGMGLGVAMYLKQLERLNRISVRRVSGCSIGSIIALYYLVNIDYKDINKMFLDIRNCFQENFNLTRYKHCVRRFIYSNMSDDLSSINNVLQLTYYDLNSAKQIVQNKFKNREDLLESIVKSSHLPFISNREFKYQGRYIDGITPYVFHDNKRPVLFVMIITKSNYWRVFNTSKEESINERLLLGINDIDAFFNGTKSHMCSYYNDWSLFSTISLRVREIIILSVIAMIEIYYSIYKYIPLLIKETTIFSGLENIFYSFSRDIMYHIVR